MNPSCAVSAQTVGLLEGHISRKSSWFMMLSSMSESYDKSGRTEGNQFHTALTAACMFVAVPDLYVAVAVPRSGCGTDTVACQQPNHTL